MHERQRSDRSCGCERVCVCVCASVSASVREIVCARWRRWEKERVRANTANSKAGVTERKQIGGERAGAKLYCRQVHHHHQHRHQQQNLRPKWDGNKEWHSMCTVLLHAMLWLQLCECGRVSWHTRFFSLYHNQPFTSIDSFTYFL